MDTATQNVIGMAIIGGVLWVGGYEWAGVALGLGAFALAAAHGLVPVDVLVSKWRES